MTDPYADIAAPVQDAYAGIAAEDTSAPLHTYSTKGPKGKVVTFQGPADATDAEIRKLAVKATGSRVYARSEVRRDGTPLAPEPESAGRAIGVGVRNVIEGAASIPDLVAAPLNTLVNATAGTKLSTTPFADAGRGAADLIGLPQEANDVDRAIGAITRGGASALGMAGSARALAGGGNYILGELAKAPFAQTVAGAAAGGFGEAARQAGGGEGAQTLASLAGGVIAPAGGTAASQAARSLTGLATRSGALNTAARTLQTLAVSPEAAANRIRYAPTPVSGAQPTLAEVAGDAGLAGLQRGHSNINPTAAAAVGERMQLNAIARTRTVDETMGPGSPQRLQDVGRTRVTAARDATERSRTAARETVDRNLTARGEELTGAADAARTRLGDLTSGVGPTVDRAATGTAARGAFTSAYETAKGTAREAYRAPALEARTPVEIPRDFFKSVRNAADDFYGDGGGSMPPEMAAILDDAAAPGATTRTLANIERRLSDFAGNARMAGRRSEAAFAERIRNDFAGQTNSLSTPEYRDALSAARAARAGQGRTFETGDAAGAFATDRYGNPTVQNTELPTRLVRPGAPGGDTADGLISAIGPEASERIAREEMRRLTDGVATGRQATALVQRHSEMLSRFPSLRADLDNWAAAAGDADQAAAAARIAPKPTAEETASLAAVSPEEAAIAGTPLSRVADEGVEPSSYVGQLLRRADGGRELRKLTSQIADDPAALDGARRAMADFVKDAGKGPNLTAAGDNVPSANPTRQAIQTVLQRSGKLLSGQQRVVLQKVSRELEGVNFATSAGRPAGSETAMNKTFSGILGKQILGVAGPGTQLLSHALSLLGNGQQVQRFVTDALLDPKFAAELLTRATPRRIKALSSRLQSSTVGAAAGSQGQ